MSDINVLKSKISSTLSAAADRAAQRRQEYLREHDELTARVARFDALVDKFCSVWRPRLQSLVEHFANLVQVKPVIQPHSREATFAFASDKFKVDLKFSMGPDRDVRHMILDYDLSIIPTLMKYEAHQRLELPLDQVNEEVIAQWLDDRILQFVDTYITLQGDDFVLDHFSRNTRS